MEKRKEQNLYYAVPNYGEPVEVSVRYDEYNDNSSLAVLLYTRPKDDFGPDGEIMPGFGGLEELYAVITVNLPESDLLPWDTQFIDNNNHPWAYKWLIDNDIAEPTGLICRSGFCSYPAMKFHIAG